MNHIEPAINELRERIKQMEQAVVLLEDLRQMPFSPERPVAVRPTPPRPRPPVKTGGRENGRAGGMGETLRGLLPTLPAQFTGPDARKALRAAGVPQTQLSNTNKFLERFAAQGLLSIQGRGWQRVYSKAGLARDRDPAPPTAGPASKRSEKEQAPGEKPGLVLRPMSRGDKLTDVMRSVIAKWGPGHKFTRADLEAVLEKAVPGWNGAKAAHAATNLGDMTERGELTRKGYGRMAEYTMLKLKMPKAADEEEDAPPAREPSAKEKAYRELRGEIQVPRDPDVEQTEE